MVSFESFCRVLPFYPAVTVARESFALRTPTWASFGLPLLTVCLWTAAVCLLAVAFFKRGMQSDKK